MDPARYQRLRTLLHGAASVAASGRRAWLEAACADDPALVGEVLSHLDTDSVATGAVAPAGVPGVVPSLAIAPGARLGRRAVHGEIGRGGMGVVYEADDPVLGPVVVKVVLPHLLALTSVRERCPPPSATPRSPTCSPIRSTCSSRSARPTASPPRRL